MTRAGGSKYTPVRNALILELWDAKATMAEIGAKLGMTKGQVSGQLRRLNAPRRDRPTLPRKRPTVPKSMLRAIKPTDQPPKPIEISPDEYDRSPALFDGKPLTIQTARDGFCRWIAGVPSSEAILCGHPIKSLGEVYCAHHHARAYNPSYPRRESV